MIAERPSPVVSIRVTAVSHWNLKQILLPAGLFPFFCFFCLFKFDQYHQFDFLFLDKETLMMMDQGVVVHEKNEARAFMAGVEGVTAKGDKSTRFGSDPIRASGSTLDLVAAVTSALGANINRKKRMARQRRSSSFNLLAFSSPSSSSTSHVSPPLALPARVRFFFFSFPLFLIKFSFHKTSLPNFLNWEFGSRCLWNLIIILLAAPCLYIISLIKFKEGWLILLVSDSVSTRRNYLTICCRYMYFLSGKNNWN